MKRSVKIDDIMTDGNRVFSIRCVEDSKAILDNGDIVEIDELYPVKIYSGIDECIILCGPMVRAQVNYKKMHYFTIKKTYYKDFIERDYSIASIIEANHFEYVHELQDWLAENEPDFSLKLLFNNRFF